jgi:hypothetical protein
LEPHPNAPESLACDVLAHGSMRATPAEIPRLRQHPGPPTGLHVPTTFLKHADDQTVVGMSAVLQAIASHGLGAERFVEWGALAAPRFLGRITMAATLERFAAEGAWAVSPNLIPHRTLHSISGTLSQMLKLHGPNLGIGGGPGALLEVLRIATAMLHGDRLPGLWVVLTGWDPEPVPDRAGEPLAGAHCVGVALALTTARPGWRGRQLRLAHSEANRSSEERCRTTDDLLSLHALVTALSVPGIRTGTVVWQFEGGERLELEQVETGHGFASPHGWPPGAGKVGVGSSAARAESSL